MTPEQFVVIYDRYKHCEPISDEELNTAIPYLEDKVDFLDALGLRFELACSKLRSVLVDLQEFQERRKK